MTSGLAVRDEPQQRTSTWLPVAAIGVSVVLWASAFVAIRHVGRDVSAGGLALGRLLVGEIVLHFGGRPGFLPLGSDGSSTAHC